MQNKKSTKRIQVDKNQSTILIFVGISAVITVLALVVSRALWTQSRYIAKVVDKKELALDQLEKNKEEVTKLTQAYNQFDEQSPNMIGGDKGGPSSVDGSNSTIVLDALPNKYDFPALASSLESMLIGYDVDSIAGTDDAITMNSNPPTGVTPEIPFSFSVSTDYMGLVNLLNTFDSSIRPFSAKSLELTAGKGLKVTYTGKTYYQPDIGLKITKEMVP